MVPIESVSSYMLMPAEAFPDSLILPKRHSLLCVLMRANCSLLQAKNLGVVFKGIEDGAIFYLSQKTPNCISHFLRIFFNLLIGLPPFYSCSIGCDMIFC